MISNFIRRNGLRVATVECNKSGSFENMQMLLQGTDKGDFFKIKGVTYYKGDANTSLRDILMMDYDAVVLDIGVNIGRFRSEFSSSNIPIVVARYNDWKITEIDEFYSANQRIMPRRTKWIVPFVENRDLLFLKRNYKQDFLSLPFCKDPLVKNKTVDDKLFRLFI